MSTSLLTLHRLVLDTVERIGHRVDRALSTLADDDGQATTEYALVLLGAALVALLVVAWASSGGTAGRIGTLFDKVIDSVIDRL
ncbi:MAG: hypothetical protein ACKOA2_05990 [Ilumatobacteraceae bacterium]